MSEPDRAATVAQNVVTEDTIPVRPRARREIKGRTPNGIEIKGTAFANPLPDSLDYGPFYGEGNFALSRAGSYVVGNIQFEEIPMIIALLQEVLAAAEAGDERG